MLLRLFCWRSQLKSLRKIWIKLDQISGMDFMDKIVNTPRDKKDKPNQNQVMKSVTVDTLGVNYGEPEVSKK